MAARPEILFPLFAQLQSLSGIGDKTARALETLGITQPRDLLFWLPTNGIDRRLRDSITEVLPGDMATVEIEVLQHRPGRTKTAPYRVAVKDSDCEFELVFFHANSAWLSKQLPEGEQRIISGKVESFDQALQIVHPDFILPVSERDTIPLYEPVYRLAAGVTGRIMSKALVDVLSKTPAMAEWIDPELKAQKSWPDWGDALQSAHNPSGIKDISPESTARMRLAYDEFFAHQLTLSLARAKRRKYKGKVNIGTGVLQQKVLDALSFRPTNAQLRATQEITKDLASDKRMNRLLQGDVGSGKTLVALMSLLVAVEANGQGVFMAPTEILARQHMQALQPLAQAAGVVIELLTGRDKGRDRKQKLEALSQGKIDILVGTHAVFQKDVEFQDLRLAIIDEQHRFGVSQRLELGSKGQATDVLVMTATPIPRSLALAQYGDMDVSILDEKPPGRIPIKTVLVSLGRLEEVVERLRRAIAQGAQCYWVCPLVEESEVMDMTAAEERFKRLRATLGEDVVGLVHGQMPPTQKDEAMVDFVSGKTKLLVATTVIEVGVDVPNASIMVIEHAENFGLAQLHQLRGRVGRGQAESTCLLMYQPPLTHTGEKRLEVMRNSEDGFVISQADLELRGAGDVLGTAQSGVPRFWIADLEHQAGLMATAQKDARLLLQMDPELRSKRGQAARVLLWLMRQDESIRLISVG